MVNKQFPIMIKTEDKEEIDRAAAIETLSLSSFIRCAAITKARKILKENKEETE